MVKLALFGPDVRLMTRSLGCRVVSMVLARIGVGTAPIIALKVGVVRLSWVRLIVCRSKSLVSVCRVGCCVVIAIRVFSVVSCILSVRFIGLKLVSRTVSP